MAKKEKKTSSSVLISRAGTSEKDKMKQMEEIMNQVNTTFGAGTASVRSISSGASVEFLPTGMMEVDWALGGGIARNRIIEIFGPESSGKTTLALHIIALVQRIGGFAAFVDAEHALDPSWATNIGVNMDELLVAQPDCGEDSLNITEGFATNPLMDVVVVDSVASLVPKAEIEGEVGDVGMALQARMMSQALRKLVTAMGRSKGKCIVIFVNQIRMKIGVMFGSPETTTGGNALKFYASQRLEVRRSTIEKDDDIPVYNQVLLRVVKNKVAPPYRNIKSVETGPAGFAIHYGKGLMFSDSAAHFIRLHHPEFRPIPEGNKTRGSWYDFDGTRCNGAGQLSELIDSDQKARKKILSTICDLHPEFDKSFYVGKAFETCLESINGEDVTEAEAEPKEAKPVKETPKKK